MYMINSRFLSQKITLEEDIKISQEDFYLLKDFIYEKSGILLQDSKKEFLANRVKNRLKNNNFSNFKDYYYYYLKYETDDREFKMLMDAVTVNETKFFRNIPLLDTFKEIILSDFSKRERRFGAI